MSLSLFYGPIEMSSTCLSGYSSPEAFVAILNAFEVRHNAGQEGVDCYEFDVERNSLQAMTETIRSGNITDQQTSVYTNALQVMDVGSGMFLQIIDKMLLTKTPWIRIAWW